MTTTAYTTKHVTIEKDCRDGCRDRMSEVLHETHTNPAGTVEVWHYWTCPGCGERQSEQITP